MIIYECKRRENKSGNAAEKSWLGSTAPKGESTFNTKAID
jgi:hypothetical protein